MDLDNNAHSVFLLHYHLVLVVKYRRRVFNKSISNRAKEIFEYIVEEGVPGDKEKIMGRVFLEPEFLPSYHGWRTDRGNPEVYRKPGAEEPKER